MNKTKLLFIINSFSAGGGAESLLTAISNALCDTGRYEISIMEIIHYDVKTEPIRDAIKLLPYYTLADAEDRKSRMYYVYHEWDKVISEYIPDGFDLYISFNYLKPSFLLPKGKKNIAWIHGDLYNLANRYPGTRDMSEERELQRSAFSKAQVIVAISDKTRQSIEDLYPEYKAKVRTIYNGIDVDRVLSMALEPTDVLLCKPSVIIIGRLEKGKDPLRALKIFKILHEIQPDVHLYYLGYGDLMDQARSMATEFGLSKHVHFLGYYDNPFPIIKQADVVLMTSKSEGFPMSLLESVSLGIPFVSTDVGGSRELAKCGSCGKVFDSDQEAVDDILEYFAMEKDEIKKNAVSAMAHFNMNKYLSEIENVINEVLNS